MQKEGHYDPDVGKPSWITIIWGSVLLAILQFTGVIRAFRNGCEDPTIDEDRAEEVRR